MRAEALVTTSLPNRKPIARGKVRDMYDNGDTLIIVATDRISAFDWINPIGIPDKGKILTQMSLFWFDKLKDVAPNHLLSSELKDLPSDFQDHPDQFEGRTMLVRKCSMFPVEFVIRGYLAGSGWKEYKESGRVCGVQLPAGLREADRLATPIFTPATKATDGHDINISAEEASGIIGKDALETASSMALRTYLRAHDFAREKGIVLCDTKFEFGVCKDQILLADEILTPDSSRYWPADRYSPGKGQPSYDKQFVRDWLETTGWDKNSPPPPLPPDVVAKTREKYVEAYRQLTGDHSAF